MLAVEVGERTDLDHRRGDEMAVLGARREFEPGEESPAPGEVGEMRVERGARLLVDHRADIGGKVARVADGQRLHRPADHRQHAVGDIVLDEQHAQRRAALPRALERRSDDVAGDLFGERGRIDDHRILSTGLGDQRKDRAVAVGQCAIDDPRGVGRAGERNAAQQRVSGERGAGLACARRKQSDVARDPGFVHQVERERADQRGLLGGLGDGGIARGERRGDRADEDREREIPR